VRAREPERVGYVERGGVRVGFEVFGSAGPAIIFLPSWQILHSRQWKLQAPYLARHTQVITYDARGNGRSDRPGAAGCYAHREIVADAVAVLDAVGVDKAHVMGVSMGGMIVQQLAIHHRDRLLTMISVMSRTGEREYGQPTPEAWALLTTPGSSDRESAIKRSVDGMRIWGSPEYADEDRCRQDAAAAYDRNVDPAGVVRQFMAVGAAGSWAADLPGVTTPTLVIHGDKDTLIDISGGRRTAELIPGARFVEIDGMGHDYPPQLWDRLVQEIKTFCGV